MLQIRIFTSNNISANDSKQNQSKATFLYVNVCACILTMYMCVLTILAALCDCIVLSGWKCRTVLAKKTWKNILFAHTDGHEHTLSLPCWTLEFLTVRVFNALHLEPFSNTPSSVRQAHCDICTHSYLCVWQNFLSDGLWQLIYVGRFIVM